MQRLSKALAAAGVAARRKCEELIFAGRVSVNGRCIYEPQFPIDWEKDQIRLDGKKIQGEEKKVYYLFHKPEGVICTQTVKKGGALRVLDFFSHLPQRLFTIGRLDLETSGLLIVTNDGQFAHQLMHPSSEITKEYLVKTAQEITDAHLKLLSRGMQIEGTFIRPHSVKKVRRGTLKISLYEGKKHEVRTLMAAAQLSILELMRIRLGPYTLGGLAPGEYRLITPV
jgi:23S rRNA pseudouridine2605 synthase